ncbi:MAG: carboxypeptidase regulatory-like domain-containing protein [Candidatus Cloacimonadota bacterium]|nr:MAG: carboxypeptidase regulatory-like domain-containing protein [Candidatus Cloacimonadota bacterium]
MKKGILPLILVIAVSLILAISCEKVEEVIGITISGNVSNGGQPVSGAFVLLVNNISDIISGSPLSNGMITLSNGNYTIIKVEDGTYYVCAVKDENGNNSYDFGTDPIGWYSHLDSLTHLTIPDSVIVSGNDVPNIDIDTLYFQSSH